MSSKKNAVRALLVEDSLVTRMGILALLETEKEIRVVGQAASGVEALALFETLKPDIVVTDLRMPGMDGVELIGELIKRAAAVRVLVLTHYDGEDYILGALRAGALGYVTKEADRKVLVAAIEAVAAGQRYLPAELASRVDETTALIALSPREQQVLELICKGQVNKEIAASLSLSEKTVSMFMVRLYAKLRVHNRAEAVSFALQKGLVRHF